MPRAGIPLGKRISISKPFALFVDALNHDFETLVVHMTQPCDELASLLKSADYVVNLCYGFGNYNQAEVATWLDLNDINHLSSCGECPIISSR